MSTSRSTTPKPLETLRLTGFGTSRVLGRDREKTLDALIPQFEALGGQIKTGITFTLNEGNKRFSHNGPAAGFQIPTGSRVFPICQAGENRSQVLHVILKAKQSEGKITTELPHGAEGSVDPFIVPTLTPAQLANSDSADWDRETAYQYNTTISEPSFSAELKQDRVKRAEEDEVLRRLEAKFNENGARILQRREPAALRFARQQMDELYYQNKLIRQASPASPSYIIAFNRGLHVTLARLVEVAKLEQKANPSNPRPLSNVIIQGIDSVDPMVMKSLPSFITTLQNMTTFTPNPHATMTPPASAPIPPTSSSSSSSSTVTTTTRPSVATTTTPPTPTRATTSSSSSTRPATEVKSTPGISTRTSFKDLPEAFKLYLANLPKGYSVEEESAWNDLSISTKETLIVSYDFEMKKKPTPVSASASSTTRHESKAPVKTTPSSTSSEVKRTASSLMELKYNELPEDFKILVNKVHSNIGGTSTQAGFWNDSPIAFRQTLIREYELSLTNPKTSAPSTTSKTVSSTPSSSTSSTSSTSSSSSSTSSTTTSASNPFTYFNQEAKAKPYSNAAELAKIRLNIHNPTRAKLLDTCITTIDRLLKDKEGPQAFAMCLATVEQFKAHHLSLPPGGASFEVDAPSEMDPLLESCRSGAIREAILAYGNAEDQENLANTVKSLSPKR